MLVYFLVILLILILESRVMSINTYELRGRTETTYLRIICFILVMLAALRAKTVGADTMGYIQDYESIYQLSFRQILLERADYPGFYVLAKLCSLLHLPVQILFGVLAGIYLYSIYRFINRYSDDKLYSILCFTMIGLYEFSLAGLKQTLSMAFALLCFMELVDKKIVLAIVMAIVAYFCHPVSLIFLFGIGLYLIRNLKGYYLYLTLIVVVMLVGTRLIWSFFLAMLENDHYTDLYAGDQGYSSATMIYYGVLFSILLVFSGKYRKKRTSEANVMLGLSALAFTFQAFSAVSSSAFRLSYFYLPFMAVAFPNAFNNLADKNMKIILKSIVVFMIVFFFAYANRNGGSVVPYRFFWQM